MAIPALPPVPPLNEYGFADPTWQKWLNYLRARIVAIISAFQLATANGFTGNVVTDGSGTATLTLSITTSGVLKGVSGGIVAAVPGTDYIVGVTATLPLSQSGGAIPNISMTQASSSVNGWLASGDWTTFNGKISAITATGDATGASTGSPTGTLHLTLAVSGVTAGTYGSATNTPVVTVDAKGRVTSAGNVVTTPAFSSITGTPTTATGYGIASIDGIPIGATTPAAGTFTTAIAGEFSSSSATVASVSGVAVTVYAIPNAAPTMLLVSVNIGATNDATNYSAFAVIATDGTSARIVFSNNGALQTITLSGLNVQSTQTSGGAATIHRTVTRIG